MALSPEKGLAQYSIQVWDVKNGLPGASVRALAQTPDGALWVATLGGIVRYDGMRFIPMGAIEQLRGAADDTSRILAARDGTVWLGSNSREPIRFEEGSLRTFSPQAGLPPGAIALAWLEGAAGQIWMASTQGLLRFADGRFLRHPLQGIEPGAPLQLELDAAGSLWVGTAHGLFTIAGTELVPYPGLENAAVSALHRDRRGVLWVAAAERLLGIDGGRTIVVPWPDGAPAGPISAMDDDGNGNLWLATPHGLARVRDMRAVRFPPAGLPDAQLTAVLVDREGSLWLGTRNGGLVQVTDRTLDTTQVPTALEGVEVHSVCQDAEGALWFGTRGHGAVRWKDGKSQSYTVADGLPDDLVQAVTPGQDGEVWLGTPKGLARWRAGQVTKSGLWARPVRALYRAPGGAVWIGGDGELGQLVSGELKLFDAEPGKLRGQVRAMAEDAHGVLWVSALGSGLLRLQGERLIKTAPLTGRTFGFVRSMILDRGGALWLSTTRAGLVRVKDGNGEGNAIAFDAAVGLDEGLLYQVIEDDSGDLWLGTSHGVARVSRSSLEAVAERRLPNVAVMSFDATDRHAGVVADAIRQPGAWRARDGRLWFVTRQGVVTIDPSRVRANEVPARAVVESVLADGGKVLGARPAPLPAGTGRLEFQYGAVALLQPGRVRFRYRLDGIDRDWVKAGARRTASYASVPAGSHRFRLQACNNDGLWSEETAFAFSIAAPFYRRYWFYLLCSAGFIPLGLLLHRARMLQVRAQYMGMFSERTRLARELHDTLLQGLSAISMQLNALRAHLRDGSLEQQQEVARIEEAVSRSLRETRRAVRGLREPDSTDDRLGPALAGLARRLCGSSPVACEVTVEGTPMDLPPLIADHLYRIGQEAITNALKHAAATRIDVGLSYATDRVVITVEDDGRGLDPQGVTPDPGEHFGLVGMRERAQQIGGTFAVRSAAGTGTMVEVMVKLHEDPRHLPGA